MGGDIKGKIWGGNNLKNEIMPRDIYTVLSGKRKRFKDHLSSLLSSTTIVGF